MSCVIIHRLFISSWHLFLFSVHLSEPSSINYHCWPRQYLMDGKFQRKQESFAKISMWRFHKQDDELSIIAIRILKATSTLDTNFKYNNFCCAMFSKLLFNFYLSFRAISKIITVIHFNISTQAFHLNSLSNYSLCHSTNLPTFHISPPDFCSLAVENKATKCF